MTDLSLWASAAAAADSSQRFCFHASAAQCWRPTKAQIVVPLVSKSTKLPTLNIMSSHIIDWALVECHHATLSVGTSMWGLGGRGEKVGGYIESVAGEKPPILHVGRASITEERIENHRISSMMMLPAFWFCMMMIYLYIRDVNDFGICNSILLGFVEEEAVEPTDCFWLRRRRHILI